MEMSFVWLKSHWRWGVFNGSAVCILVYVVTQGTTDWSRMDTFDSGFESGKWAVRFLLLSLSMTPLNTYFGWNSAVKLRKSAGLWSFGFACIHVFFHLRESGLSWFTWPLPDFLVFGMVGMTILGVMAATSNKWSMKRLTKNWKRLHRRVYLAGTAILAHAMLATQMSKKLMFREPEALRELNIYAAVLCVLLVVRLPFVRKLFLHVAGWLKKTQKAIKPPGTELFPQIHGRESSPVIEPTFVLVPHKTSEPNKSETVLPSHEYLQEAADRSPSDELEEMKVQQ